MIPGSSHDLGDDVDCSPGGACRGMRGGVRHQQFGRIADKPGGSPSAGDFQDALFIRFNDVRVADPDNRIISHLPSQVSERRTEYVMVL
jgi:hypothetical protein